MHLSKMTNTEIKYVISNIKHIVKALKNKIIIGTANLILNID